MLIGRAGFWILLLWVVLVHGAARAEWVAMDTQYQSHPLQIAYIDPSTIRRDGNVVTLIALIDWKAMQGGRTPTRFHSTTFSKHVDCAGKLVRTLASTDYYGHMGTFEVIGGGRHSSEDQWMAIKPGTINEGLWDAGCKKE